MYSVMANIVLMGPGMQFATIVYDNKVDSVAPPGEYIVNL